MLARQAAADVGAFAVILALLALGPGAVAPLVADLAGMEALALLA
jgi:hypothetical protein